MFSSPKSATRGGIPVASIAGTAPIATPHFLQKTVDNVMVGLGLSKPPNVDLTLEQQQALALLDKGQQDLMDRQNKVRAAMGKKLAINKNDKCVVENHELGIILLQRSSLVNFAINILNQKQTLETRRMDGKMLGILGRGNAEIKRETQRIQKEVDASTISDDLSEVLTEGIEDQIEMNNALAGVSISTDDMLSTVQVADSNNPDGVGSIGDIVAREFEEMRSQAAATAEQSSLELREQMPTTHTLPNLVRPTQQQQQQQSNLTPLSGGRQAFPASAMMANPSYASSSSMTSSTPSTSSARTSPFSQSQAHAFSAEDDWLA